MPLPYGRTQDTNKHLHDEKLRLPIYEQLQLHASQYKQVTTSITPPTQTYNKLQHTKPKETLSLTTTATQQTFPKTTTQSLQQTQRQTCAIYIHLSFLGT